MKKGIDVAKWQGTIDWSKVKRAGVEFAVLKIVNKSMEKEDFFEQNYKGATDNDIPIGVYNYSYAETVEKAKSDAISVVNFLENRPLEYGVWLDVEDDVQKNIGQKLISIISAYQKIVENAGYFFGVYTGLSFYNSYIKPYASQIDCPFWIARYPSGSAKELSYTPDEKYKPAIKHELYAWQYSSKGTIDGITGNVDMNILYEEEKEMNQPIDYKQYDSRWKNTDYSTSGESTTIGRAGCGTTCAAMVIASLKDSSVTPVTTSDWSLRNGYKCKGGGTYYSYFVPQFAKYGITCKRVNTVNLQTKSRADSLIYHNEVLQALQDGKWVIACMGKGNWTTSGHYILIYGYENGYIYVNDPASTKANRIKNTFELAMQQVKYWWIVDTDIIESDNTNMDEFSSLTKKYNAVLEENETLKTKLLQIKELSS